MGMFSGLFKKKNTADTDDIGLELRVVKSFDDEFDDQCILLKFDQTSCRDVIDSKWLYIHMCEESSELILTMRHTDHGLPPNIETHIEKKRSPIPENVFIGNPHFLGSIYERFSHFVWYKFNISLTDTDYTANKPLKKFLDAKCKGFYSDPFSSLFILAVKKNELSDLLTGRNGYRAEFKDDYCDFNSSSRIVRGIIEAADYVDADIHTYLNANFREFLKTDDLPLVFQTFSVICDFTTIGKKEPKNNLKIDVDDYIHDLNQCFSRLKLQMQNYRKGL